ncbi:MAG: NADH:flavin oxidoreductase [Polyangiaceae bacterium]|nr:NADH:flavin oxidoreductase [Polyangiaceae bacterium]
MSPTDASRPRLPTLAPSAPFTPFTLGSLTLRNRIVKSATYEGMVHEGLPTPALVRHHRELAAGGTALTTVAYCAVSPDGRTFSEQLMMSDRAIPAYAAVTDAVHAEGGAAALQLGHAGGFSKSRELRLRRAPLGPSFAANPYGLLSGIPFVYALREPDLRAIEADFVAAAVRARSAGFDAVELHLGHGYLLSQLLSPVTNRRTDAYGGSLDNRLRFPLRVLAAVRAALGPGFPVLCKMNLDDGVPGGLHVEEAVEIARALERGGASALVLSGGMVSRSAFFLLRGERPLRAMISVEPKAAQKLALALFGPLFVKAYPFEPLFFLPLARRVRAAVRLPLALLGGVTSRADLERALALGFELVALGRALLHDPGLPGKYARGEAERSGCEPCNLCIAEMDRPGGVCCAQVPAQLARREREVAAGWHRQAAG